MKATFTLLDITKLIDKFNSSSISNDCMKRFLNKFSFESVYTTEDNSTVFIAGGENDIQIEFFNFNNPLTRTFSVMYLEHGKYNILDF